MTRPSHRARLYVLSGKRIEKSRVIEEEATARLKDSPRLEVTLNLVRKEHHAELAGHNVKTLILKRQCQSICLFPLEFDHPEIAVPLRDQASVDFDRLRLSAHRQEGGMRSLV